MWGAELGWRGQERWEQKMVDLQCQALSKCMNTVRRTQREIAGVESPRTALDAAQALLLGKMMRDPAALGDMWMGPGKDIYRGRIGSWGGRKDCSLQWENSKDDDFTSVTSAILNKAAMIGDGVEGLSVGGRVEKGEIPEAKLQANAESKADKWELAIHKARKDAIGVGGGGDGTLTGRKGDGEDGDVMGRRGGGNERGIASSARGP